MRLYTKMHRILGSRTREQHYPDGPNQDQRRHGLAIPTKPHGYSIIPRVYRVLSILHTQLLTSSTPPTGPNKESDALGLDRNPNTSIRNPEKTNVFETSINPTTIRQTICGPHRRIGIWRGCHTLTRGRCQPPKTFKTTPPSNRILFGNIYTN